VLFKVTCSNQIHLCVCSGSAACQLCLTPCRLYTCLQVAYDITTSVSEAVEQMAALIKLTNYQTFTLYEATRPINFKMSPEPMPEEHMLLDENRCAIEHVQQAVHHPEQGCGLPA